MPSFSSSAFNHSCLKVPVNPSNKLPSPIYEQKYVNQIKNETLQGNNTFIDFESEINKMKTNKANQNIKYKQFIDFYDSIPDYSDVNHLSNKDFYKKLDAIKAKQKCYYDYLDTELNIQHKADNFIEEYKEEASGRKSTNRTSPKLLKQKLLKNHHKSIHDNNTILIRRTPETDDSLSSCKEIVLAPPSRRSVRIESPKSDSSTVTTRNFETPNSQREKYWSRNVGSAESKYSESSKFISSLVDSICDEDKDFCDDILKDNQIDDLLKDKDSTGTKSLPNSPTKTKNSIVWNDCGITIPKPFKMTVRDEEDKIVEEILLRNSKTPKGDKSELFRAHHVPIESKIPLFDKIMEEQEIRRQVVKKKSKEALKAKMKPFSFTKREEEEQALTRRFSKSSPELSYEDIPLKIKPFKAKPVPKNLFSNYIYAKMHEDEFYRALKRKIRAEEMLKASNLPPSMAYRARTQRIKSICPRALREIEKEIDNEIEKRERETNLKISNRISCHEHSDQDLGDSENSFITTSRPFKFQTQRRFEKRARSAKKCHRASEYEPENKRAQSALELQSVNRSNLAAVLRIQSASFSNISSIPTARRRMEREMGKKLEEQKIQNEIRWKEKIMRKKPVWQDLKYSHEEDIAFRLQMRRDEERLRHDEHRHHMDLMIGRVQQIPTLFERQSNYIDFNKDKTNDEC